MKAKEILEAPLSGMQLNKRDNWNVLANKIKNGETFKLGKTGDQGEVIIDPQEELLQALSSREFAGTKYKVGQSVKLPIAGGGSVSLTSIFKDQDFGGIAGGKATSERQETGLIESINSAIEQNGGPITLVTADTNLKDVSAAFKVDGTNEYGKEPYADIGLKAGGKRYLVSAKGPKVPSIAGGGLSGLHNLDPDIIRGALDTALAYYKKNHSHLEGKQLGRGKLPEVYSKIDHKYLDTIIRGDKKMGGPIDFMYIGPMDVTSEYNNGILKVSGSLVTADEYISSVDDIFLRIRRRTQEQVLTFDKTDRQGYPSIFYAAGEGHRRLLVVPKKDVPQNARPYTEDLFVKKET